MEKSKSGKEAVKSFQSKGGEEKIVKLFFNGEKRYPFSHPSTLMSLSEGREKRRKTRECILRCPPRPSRDPSNVSDRLSFFFFSSFFFLLPLHAEILGVVGGQLSPLSFNASPKIRRVFPRRFFKISRDRGLLRFINQCLEIDFLFRKVYESFSKKIGGLKIRAWKKKCPSVSFLRR